MFDGLTTRIWMLCRAEPDTVPARGQVLFRRGTRRRASTWCANLMQLSVSNSEGMVKVVETSAPETLSARR